MVAASDKLAKARREYKDLQAAIEDRRKYSTEQEALIQKLLTDGNELLKSLEFAIACAKSELSELKVSVRTLRQDKKLLERDIEFGQSTLAKM